LLRKERQPTAAYVTYFTRKTDLWYHRVRPPVLHRMSIPPNKTTKFHKISHERHQPLLTTAKKCDPAGTIVTFTDENPGRFTKSFLLLVLFLRPSRNLGQNVLQLAKTAFLQVLTSYLLSLSQLSGAVWYKLLRASLNKLQTSDFCTNCSSII
jgi:hypothetical protein